VDRRWPDEPEEPDPEQRWGSPELDLPRVPTVDVPESTPGDDTAVDPEIQRTFWTAVVLANVAVFGVTVGPMLVYFRGRWLVGLGLVGVGLVALARTYTLYREFQAVHDDDETAPAGAEDEGDGSRAAHDKR
jgi:hypothetical protein